MARKSLLGLVVLVLSLVCHVQGMVQNTNLAFQVGFSAAMANACYRYCRGDRDPACERVCTEMKGKTVTLPALKSCITNEMTLHKKTQMDAHSDCTKMRHPCVVVAQKKVLAKDLGGKTYKCAMAAIMFQL